MGRSTPGRLRLVMTLVVLGGAIMLSTPAASAVAQGPAIPPHPYGFTAPYVVQIPGGQTYTSQKGGCLFLEGVDPGLSGPINGVYGYPVMETYGSINWNSKANGSGTPCGNQSAQISGGDFYVTQVLNVFNSATRQ